MAGKIYRDPEIGDIELVKTRLGRRVSIKVHPVRGVVVTVPFFMRYQDGLDFFMRKREWVAGALRRQQEKTDAAERSGTAVGTLRDGVTVRTLLSEIHFVRSRAGGCGHADGQYVRNADPAGAGGPLRKPDGVSGRTMTVSSALMEDVSRTGRLYLSPFMPVSRKQVSYPGTMPPEGSAELSSALGQALVKILRDEARTLLPQKLAFFARRYGFVYARVTIKHNSTNWGSCSARGNINLNLNLVRLPEPVCDYVILHELCHLRHPDHGPGFHALLEDLCADNMKRLSLLVDGMREACLSAGDARSGAEASVEYFRGLVSAMRRSRAKFPVHHVLEQEVRKYRLV